MDVLRVALTHQEDDRRGIRRRVIGEFLDPVLVDETCLGNLIHVIGQGQRDHICLEPIAHRPGLLARTAMRLGEGHVFAGFFFPFLLELRIELREELTGRVIGDIEELLASAAAVCRCIAAAPRQRPHGQYQTCRKSKPFFRLHFKHSSSFILMTYIRNIYEKSLWTHRTLRLILAVPVRLHRLSFFE